MARSFDALVQPPLLPPTRLAQRAAEGFAITVELDPPRGFDPTGVFARVKDLVESGLVDTVNVSDNALAQIHMSALATCALLQARMGVETVLHVTTRHRNLLALHAELLGAQSLGIRNVLTIRGDPPQIGDYPEATAISDITPSELVRFIKDLNRGSSRVGAVLEHPTSFFVGCALNLNAQDQDRELHVLERKLKAGADFVMAQPVYDPEVVHRWVQRLGKFPVPLLLGVLPLRTFRHAEFLHNEVPGILIPKEVRDRLRGARTPSEEGLVVAEGLLKEVHSLIGGLYMMAPFGRYKVLLELLKRIQPFIPNLGYRGVSG
jgi:5,10-methylenetetrahydrofolate reductase